MCFECGDNGHIGRNCPNRAKLDIDLRPPPWCGKCDQHTRHRELADNRVKRCRCHPESHLQLKQHRKCGQCYATVVAWDSADDCSRHILASITRPYIGALAAPPAPDAMSKAAGQVAESRAWRHERGIEQESMPVPGNSRVNSPGQ